MTVFDRSGGYDSIIISARSVSVALNDSSCGTIPLHVEILFNEYNFVVYPDFVIHQDIKNRIKSFNNLIVYEQIKTINESIKMVNHKNFYFENLLLKIFSDNRVDRFKIILL